jgi:hypothetical protein
MDYNSLNIDFILDGQLMTAGNAPADLRPKLARIEDDFRSRLSGLIDPKTGRPPKVIMRGDKALTDLKFSIEASKETIEEAQKRLGGAAG